MATLDGKKIKDTYKSLLKVDDNGTLDENLQQITDAEGNTSGLRLNNLGDAKIDGTLEVGSLKYTNETVNITKFVDQSDGIANNDNDNTLPTSAAVKDYVDNNITDQDLDIAGDTGAGAVDLDSESLSIVGIGGIETTVSGQTVTIDPSGIDARLTENENLIDLQITDLTDLTQRVGVNETDISNEIDDRISGDSSLQSAINSEASTRAAADSALQINIDNEAATRLANDNILQGNIDNEASTRASADTTLQSNIDTEATQRTAADTTLQNAIDAEALARDTEDVALQSQITINSGAIHDLDTDITTEVSNRVAADVVLQDNIDAEATARGLADTTLQDNIDSEANTRATADTTLQSNIDTEASQRTSADTTLQYNIDTEETARIAGDAALQSQIDSNDTDITALQGAISGVEGDFFALDSELTQEIADRTAADSALQSQITSNDSDITTLSGDISNLQSSKQSVSEKGQANGYAPLDSGAKINEAYLPDSILGQVEYQGTWNAATNTPALGDPTTQKGHYYVVDVEGEYLGVTYHVGDWAISNGTLWEHVHNTDLVITVFGRLGDIVANESDYSAYYPLIADLTAETSARTSADANLQSQIDAIEGQDISAIEARVTQNETDISTLDTSKQDNLTAGTGISIVGDTISNTITNNNQLTNGAGYTTNVGDITGVTAGGGISGGGTSGSVTVSHADTSAQSSVNNSGATVIQDVTVDGYGHVTGLGSKTMTLADLGYTGATNANNYTHPSYAGDDINVDTGALTGATVVSDIDFNVTTDSLGHVTDANGVVSTRNLTLANLGYTGATNANYITNNNQLTNGAGYTTNVGDITGVTAGTNLTGGGSSGSVTLNMATGGIGAGTYGSTSNSTKIDNITVDAYGRVTGITTGGTGNGDITAVTAGTNLTGGGSSGSVTLNLASTIDVTRVDIGNEIQLQESTDRTDLLQITSVTSGWAGIQLRNSSNEGRWSLMTDGATFGVYDDENSDWAIQASENSEVRLYYNASERLNTHSSGVTVTGDLTVSGGDIVLGGTGRIQGIDTVSASTDAANKAYVDNTAAALVTGVTAGAGLDGGGTSGTVSLSIEPDLRGETWLIGRNTSDYYYSNTTYHDWFLDGNRDMRLETDGDLHVDGDVIAYSTTTSDRRLKDNIKTIDNALDKVEQLRGVEYDWNKGSRKGQHEIGLIAQEVEEVFPFLVKEKVKTTGDFQDDDTAYKSVDYEKLVGVLIESVKELSAKVKTLEAKLK